ncbi:MAG: hypothetical protein ACM3PW_03220 [Chlamydiota bacterium]
MKQPLGIAASKKRILLVATDEVRRDLRARVMRKMGVDVDCAADISEARSLWRADSYNLVLLDVIQDTRHVEEFCCDIKAAKPPQAVAFLVGKPEYLAASPNGEVVAGPVEHSGPVCWGEVVASLFTSACESLPRRWGFQEAAWRMAAARSMKDPSRNSSRPGPRVGARAESKAAASSWAEAVAQHSKPAVEVLPMIAGTPLLAPQAAAETAAEAASDPYPERTR